MAAKKTSPGDYSVSDHLERVDSRPETLDAVLEANLQVSIRGRSVAHATLLVKGKPLQVNTSLEGLDLDLVRAIVADLFAEYLH